MSVVPNISEAYAARMFDEIWVRLAENRPQRQVHERLREDIIEKGEGRWLKENAFLKAYNIDEDDFNAADISWEELAAIYDDYLSKEEKLRGDRQRLCQRLSL